MNWCVRKEQLCYLIWSRYLIRSRDVAVGFSPPKFYFMRAQHVLRYHMIYVPWLKILVVKTDDIILQIFNFLVMFHHLPKSLVTSVGAFSLITCCSCSWNMWRRLKNRHGHRLCLYKTICIEFLTANNLNMLISM